MRRSIVVLILLVFASVLPCVAQDVQSGVTQGLTAATFFDFKSMDVLAGGITSLVNYKEYVSFDAGLVTSDIQKVAIVGGLGINLGKIAKSFPGWNVNAVFEQARVGGFVAKHMEEGTTIDMYGLYIGTYIKF